MKFIFLPQGRKLKAKHLDVAKRKERRRVEYVKINESNGKNRRSEAVRKV